jgi:hypothetical protein
MNRGTSGFTGRGAYFGAQAGGYLGHGLASLAGASSRGREFGRQLGSTLGDYGEDVLMGRGAYHTNQLINPKRSLRPVVSASNESGDITISHREFIAAITPTSAAFQTQYFQALNPGLSGFAPWLSQLAEYFEEYEFVQCVFEFKSLVTEGNATAAGEVIMATQYNPTNVAFTSQGNMENYDYAKSCKMTDSMLHGVECHPMKHAGSASEYIRTGPVPSGQDPKTFDLAVFQLATVGAAVNTLIGNLYVHYTVRLSKAKVLIKGASPATNALTAGQSLYSRVLTTGSSQLNCANGFGLPNTSLSTFAGIQSQIGSAVNIYFDPNVAFKMSFVPSGNNFGTTTLQFPAWVNVGRYLVSVQISTGNPTSTGTSILDIPDAVNCVVSDFLNAPIPSSTNTAVRLMCNFVVNVTAPGSTQASLTWVSSASKTQLLVNAGTGTVTSTSIINISQCDPLYTLAAP